MPLLSLRALFDICLMWLLPFHLEYCQTDMRSCRFHAQAREKLIADIYISISTGTFDIENIKYEKKWQQLDLDTNFEP